MADFLPVLHQASVGPGLLVRDPGKAGAVEHQEVYPGREEYVERCGRWLAKVCGNVEIGFRTLGPPSTAAEGKGETRASIAPEGLMFSRRTRAEAD